MLCCCTYTQQKEIETMNNYIRSLHNPHLATDSKVPKANEVLFAHPDYEKIKGTKFVNGTIDPKTKQTYLNYSTPDHFTEEEIVLAEKIVNSLVF